MSSKEVLPSLAGTSIKTRKRNIFVPSDPGSFADAVIQICEDSKEGDEHDKNLEAAVKALETAELDFNRYGETLFEVLFLGGRMSTGASTAGSGKKLATNIMAAGPSQDRIVPYVKVFQTLIRRRPFLIKSLENTICKLILSLEFFDDEGRDTLAKATSRVFATKVGVLPEHVFLTMLNDRLVAKGTILAFFTALTKDFLETEKVEDLAQLLSKAKVEERLIEFFPPSKRSEGDLEKHFREADLASFVDYHKRKAVEKYGKELQSGVVGLVTDEPPASAADVVAYVKAKKQEWGLPETDLLKYTYIGLVEALNLTGKNQQQILGALAKQLKTYGPVLQAFATSGRLEAQLMVTIQVHCYEDSKLLKQFKDIVRVLYDLEIVQEDTIMYWYNKGSHFKGRNVFLKDIESFIKWLQEAEEEEEEDE